MTTPVSIIALARAAASNAVTHTPAAVAEQARKLAQFVPEGATEYWVRAFAAAVSNDGPVVDAKEITRAVLMADGLAREFAVPVAEDPKPDEPEEPPQGPAEEPITAPASGRYRSNMGTLTQAVREAWTATRIPGGAALRHDEYGPTWLYVDSLTGWPWRRPGGDWIDPDGTLNGATPWASVITAAQSATEARRYTLNVTALVQHCVAHNKPLAIMLVCAAPRTVAATDHPAAPTLTYTPDGANASAPAPLWCMALMDPTSNSPVTRGTTMALPVLLEFDRPAVQVQSAELALTVTEHWSGSDTAIRAYLVEAPANVEPVRNGLAADAKALDDGIEAQPGVIGAHRYLDEKVLADFVLPDPINHSAEMNFDPAIYGTGPTDRNKLPHRGAGKWILSSEDRANWSFVSSSYTGEGFAALAPGMGALRIRMPAAPGVVDGSVVGYSGTGGANGMLYLPEHLFGRLDRIFVRYYFRLGAPYVIKKADRKHVRYEANGATVWTTMGGKFGIAPDHSTSYGGVSGTSGGPYGWQMRGAWYDCDAEMGGPDEGGWAVGHHLYDFIRNNPNGHRYGQGDLRLERWGQRGGLGGMLYAGQWYCIETEMKLNTISSAVPGYDEDGELRTWIDGRMCYERTGMVFRSGPVATLPYQDQALRPCRELGVRGLWLNWFHGGKTLATIDRTSFYTGLVWSTKYIGPMKTS